MLGAIVPNHIRRSEMANQAKRPAAGRPIMDNGGGGTMSFSDFWNYIFG
jgi:hypothetical protein